MYVPFSVYTMASSGEHRGFIVEEFIRNGRSPVATQRAFRIRFALGPRETVPDKKTIYLWVSNFRQTASVLKQADSDTTASCCHYTLNDFQGHGQLPRETTSMYQYSRPPLE